MQIRGSEHPIAKGFFEIPLIDFFGPFARSPNGVYLFAWQDADYKGKEMGRYREGARDSGFGRVVLLRDGELLWQHDIERPNDGTVSDTGLAVINDWHFGVSESGSFYAFDENGKILVQREFPGNLLSNGITADGKLAWCTAVQNRLALFSLFPPRLLFETDCPPLEWKIQDVAIVDHNVEVATTGPLYKYDQTGALLNEWEVSKVFLQHGRIYDVLRIAEKRIAVCPPEKMPQEEIELLVTSLTQVCRTDWEASGYWKAKARRMAGELSLASGSKSNALEHFRKALSFDRKIGVTKLVRKLERELGQI